MSKKKTGDSGVIGSPTHNSPIYAESESAAKEKRIQSLLKAVSEISVRPPRGDRSPSDEEAKTNRATAESAAEQLLSRIERGKESLSEAVKHVDELLEMCDVPPSVRELVERVAGIDQTPDHFPGLHKDSREPCLRAIEAEVDSWLRGKEASVKAVAFEAFGVDKQGRRQVGRWRKKPWYQNRVAERFEERWDEMQAFLGCFDIATEVSETLRNKSEGTD